MQFISSFWKSCNKMKDFVALPSKVGGHRLMGSHGKNS